MIHSQGTTGAGWRAIYIALILLLAHITAGAQTPERTPPAKLKPRTLAITNVTVVDMSGRTPGGRLPGHIAIVEGDRIARVCRRSAVRVPRGARVIDGTSKFLIPGLWDMHVHGTTGRDIFPPLMLAGGVTGVRDTGSDDEIYSVRADAEAGKLLAPRIVAASSIVDGPKPVWDFSIKVRDAAEGRAAVVRQKRAGADLVKVYALLGRDAYLAIADEAGRQGIPFGGHVPYSVSALEASDAGQATIKHLDGLPLAMSSREAELRAAVVAEIDRALAADAAPLSTVFGARARRFTIRDAQASYDPAKAARLFSRLPP